MPESRVDAAEIDLRHFVVVLRRRWTLVVLAVLGVVVGAVAVSSLQTPVYQATAEVLLQPKAASPFDVDEQGGGGDSERTLETEISLITSAPVQQAVKDKLGQAWKVKVRPKGETDIVQVTARSTAPSGAAAVANAYATEYIEFRRAQAVKGLEAAGAQIQAKIDELQQRINALDREVRTAPLPSQAAVGERLGQQRDSLVSQQALFRARLDELQVNTTLEGGGAQVVTEASVPRSPVEPKPLRNGMVGLALGLVFGLGLAFVTDHLDDSVKTEDDLEQATGLAVVGLIPAFPSWRDRQGEGVVLADPAGTAAEAFRSLRTSLKFMGVKRELKILQVTSAVAHDGKTTTAANLGVVVAQAGQRTVIVDCDLRRPNLHTAFGLSNEVGLTSVVLGDARLSEALQRARGEQNLFVLASGPTPPDPSEFLAWDRTLEVLATLASHVEMVVIDSTPVLPVTDASVVASHADATLLVAKAGETNGKHVRRAVRTLEQVDARLVGAVLLGVAPDAAYGYGYGYGSRGEDPRGAPRRDGGAPRRARAQPGVRQAPVRDPERGPRPEAPVASRQEGAPTGGAGVPPPLPSDPAPSPQAPGRQPEPATTGVPPAQAHPQAPVAGDRPAMAPPERPQAPYDHVDGGPARPAPAEAPARGGPSPEAPRPTAPAGAREPVGHDRAGHGLSREDASNPALARAAPPWPDLSTSGGARPEPREPVWPRPPLNQADRNGARPERPAGSTPGDRSQPPVEDDDSRRAAPAPSPPWLRDRNPG